MHIFQYLIWPTADSFMLLGPSNIKHGLPVICLLLAIFSLCIVSRDMTSVEPRTHQEGAGYANSLSCPLEPLGSQVFRNVISGSPVIWLIASNNKTFRDIWRRYLLPRMRSFNFDTIFLIEDSKRTVDDTLEQANYGDMAFLKVPPYDDELTGFYFRAIKGYEWGLHHSGKQYEWFIRPDMDSYYCLHHIRLELNGLEQKLHRHKPGIHWAHFYGDGAGGQPGIPVSDVHEVFNRFAVGEALKYADKILRSGRTWNITTAEVLGSNIADLSPNVTQIHDIRWAFGPGAHGESFWNSGFLNFEHLDDCLCANWLAIHLGKTQLESRVAQATKMEANVIGRHVQFSQPMPTQALIGWDSPYFVVGGCSPEQKYKWPGCS